jgi:uncharacterized protein (UPF0335 family)
MWFSGAKRLNDMEERLWRLERDQKALQMDWESAYDKMRTLTARFVKRAEVIEKSERAEQTEQETATGSTTVSSAADPITRRILERRARMFPARKEAT